MNVTKTISDGKELVKVEGRLDSVNASQLEASVKEGLDEISELEFDFSKSVLLFLVNPLASFSILLSFWHL